ncbi:MAG: LPD7 domain-containing protein [Steroidobacteraceae bacterium]
MSAVASAPEAASRPEKSNGAQDHPDKSAPAPAAAESATQVVPEQIRQRFVQVGRKYYFPDGARAFTDRGSRLTTPSENTEVIRSLVAIAQARGWSDLTVSGTERFRKEAWFTAKLAGLSVRGYRASQFEQERLARAAGRRNQVPRNGADRTAAEATLAEPQAPRAERSGRNEVLWGRLIDHGRATYRHDPHEPTSYFVKVETERGAHTVWGVDLERAFKESLTQPQVGEEVGLRPVRKDVVTVKAPERDADGRVIGEHDLQTHRNRWVLEKREFFEARAAAAQTVGDASVAAREAVKQRPELAGTYLYLRGAEEIARRRIRDPEDQRRFVETVRGALAESVARGEPLAAVRLRERSARKPEREQGLERG